MQKVVVIGLCGGKGEGKDTLAKYLVNNYGFTRLAYGDGVYAEVAKAFNTTVEALQVRETKETPQAHLALVHCADLEFIQVMLSHFKVAAPEVDAFLNEPRSPRWVLQYWGTEYRRAAHPRYWLDIVDAQLDDLDRAVITDVRFPNEVDIVTDRDGHVRRIVMDPEPVRDNTAGHDSERSLDSLSIPTMTNRVGDLSVLHAQADALMASLGIKPILDIAA